MASSWAVFATSFGNDLSIDLWSRTARILLDTKRSSGTKIVKTGPREYMDNVDRNKLTRLVWVDCPYPLLRVGLSSALAELARIHAGSEVPATAPDAVIFGVGGVEGLLEGMKRHRKLHPQAVVLVLGLYLDLSAARSALRARHTGSGVWFVFGSRRGLRRIAGWSARVHSCGDDSGADGSRHRSGYGWQASSSSTIARLPCEARGGTQSEVKPTYLVQTPARDTGSGS